METNWLWNSYLLLALATCVILLGIAVCVALKYRRKYLLQYDEIAALLEGQGSSNNVIVETENARAFAAKYDKKKFEVTESRFSIDTSKCLGSGEFGNVHPGTITQGIDTISVAVKTTKLSSGIAQQADLIALRGLISEIKLLSYIGNHKNIVAFLVAYTGKISRGYLAVFLEYCPTGCLLNYLRKCKTWLPDDTYNETRPHILSSGLKTDILRWSYEIVNGMEYLSSKKIVHADLAARNVLLDSQFVAKLADFGLSRRLYNYTNYVKQKQEPLPWRWMAPEALQNLVFNEKTDVWAFGVLLWEIFTLGNVPYPGLCWDVEFASKLTSGLRLPVPTFDQKNMFIVMWKCWQNNSDLRPTFAMLKSELKGKLENEKLVAQKDTKDYIKNSTQTFNEYTVVCFRN